MENAPQIIALVLIFFLFFKSSGKTSINGTIERLDHDVQKAKNNLQNPDRNSLF